MRPTSSEPTTSAPRAAASAAIRATISCSSAASQSSTFIDTCTSPSRGSASPSARTPRKPPPRSRTVAAISTAAWSRPRRFTLNAISGLRAPTRTAPADGSSASGPKSGAARRPPGAGRAPRHRPAGRRPGRGRAARRGRRAGPWRRSARRASARRAARARGPRGSIGTIGTTSAAPIRGCAPSWRRRSIRSRATATASASASTSSRSCPTTVNTERLWSGSLWTSSRRTRAASARPIASIVAGSRPSEKFGTDSSGSTRLLYEPPGAYAGRR